MQNNGAAFFSVIIPTYKRISPLLKTLESLFSQSFVQFEIIIVDDACPMLSKDILEEQIETLLHKSLGTHFNMEHLKYYRLKQNLGVSAARNFGIKKASADWICFLDSDDTWEPKKLELFYKTIQANPDFLFFHSNETWIKNNQIKIQPKKFERPHGFAFEACLEHCLIGPSTSCLHKSLFFSYGFFREDFRICEDYDLWLRITSKEKIFLIKEALTNKFGGHEDQLSTQHHSMDYWRIRSLYFQLWNPELDIETKKLIQRVITHKFEILKKSFIKYSDEESKKRREVLEGMCLNLIELSKAQTSTKDRNSLSNIN